MTRELVSRLFLDATDPAKPVWRKVSYTVVCGESEPKLKSVAEAAMERAREMLGGKK